MASIGDDILGAVTTCTVGLMPGWGPGGDGSCVGMFLDFIWYANASSGVNPLTSGPCKTPYGSGSRTDPEGSISSSSTCASSRT